MADVKLKIQDVGLITTPATSNKIPVSDGTGSAKTISVAQINSLHEEKSNPHTQYALATALAQVATSGSYTDLANTPAIPTQYTDELAQDAVGAALTAGTQSGITVTYDDVNNKIDFVVAGDVAGPASATNNHVAVFDGTTGKVIKDGGAALADLATVTQLAGKENFHGIESAGTFSCVAADKTVSISEVTYWYKGVRYVSTSSITCDIEDYLVTAQVRPTFSTLTRLMVC